MDQDERNHGGPSVELQGQAHDSGSAGQWQRAILPVPSAHADVGKEEGTSRNLLQSAATDIEVVCGSCCVRVATCVIDAAILTVWVMFAF